MSKSNELRSHEMRAVFAIVGECRELGDDAVAWRMHLLARTIRLVGARVGLSGELPPTPTPLTRPQVEIGWDSPEQSDLCYDYWINQMRDDILWERVAQSDGFGRVIIRQDYVPNAEWYAQPHVQSILRNADIDGMILSGQMCQGDPPMLDQLSLFRGWKEKPPGQREKKLVQLLHDQIVPLIGTRLAASHEKGPSGLSPRKRQVLEYLLAGDSEKQMARRLRLSKATVNEYVNVIYRHFDVHSRAELMAYYLQRFRKNR